MGENTAVISRSHVPPLCAVDPLRLHASRAGSDPRASRNNAASSSRNDWGTLPTELGSSSTTRSWYMLVSLFISPVSVCSVHTHIIIDLLLVLQMKGMKICSVEKERSGALGQCFCHQSRKNGRSHIRMHGRPRPTHATPILEVRELWNLNSCQLQMNRYEFFIDLLFLSFDSGLSLRPPKCRC